MELAGSFIGREVYRSIWRRTIDPATVKPVSNSQPKRSRPARPAAYHADVRRAHAEETAEDYVEAIAHLIESQGQARVKDLAGVFGVSHVTVSRTIARLVRDGLAETQPYQPVTLTPKGQKLAQASKHRHEMVVRFLLALGLDNETAHRDAEGIEHHVSEKTLRAMANFVDSSSGAR